MLPSERLKQSNTIENLWMYILALLKRANEDKPLYAYEMREMIEKKFSFKPGETTAYRVLYRLEEEGFVKSYQIDRKRVYKITPKGIDELKKASEILDETISCIS